MKLSRNTWLTLLGILILGGIGLSIFVQSRATTVLLVRHAERLDDSANSNLSEKGLARAEALAETLHDQDLTAIYSTNFCRTALTVTPLAKAHELPIYIQALSSSGGYDNCDPDMQVSTVEIPSHLNDISAFVAHLLEAHSGEQILIAGHSNTTPALVNALGNCAFDEEQLPHDAYGDLFIVEFNGWSDTPTLSREKF